MVRSIVLTPQVRTEAMTNSRATLSAELAGVLSRLAAEGRRVFTVEQFAKAAGRPNSKCWRTLSCLCDGGWVLRLMRGKYLIVPLEAGPEAAWSEDALIVAGHLAEAAAVAYWSACHYWNWTEQVPRTVFVQTTQQKVKCSRTVLGVRYRFVRVRPEKFFGTVRRSVGDGRATLTDREKTLVDCMDRPELCGGIGQVARMLPAAAEAVDWDRVDEYLGRLGSGAVYKRLGLLVEHAGGKLRIPGRPRRVERWQRRLTGGYAPLEPERASDGPTDSRWRVRLNVPGVVEEAGR